MPLVQNLLHGGPGELKLIQDYIDTEHGGDETKFDLLTRKGVYPYSYIDGVEKFAEGIVVLIPVSALALATHFRKGSFFPKD